MANTEHILTLLKQAVQSLEAEQEKSSSKGMDWKSFSPSSEFFIWEARQAAQAETQREYVAKQKMSGTTTDKTPRQKLLEEALKITTTDRNASYGNPEDNFRNIAELWEAYFSAKDQAILLDSHDVAIMMILMKCARLATNHGHHDSAVDIAGYAACLADIQDSYRKSSFMVGATSQPTKPIDGVQFPNSKT